MTALEKLTLSRLEDRVTMLEETVHHVMGRLELVEQGCCAVSDACATLLIRVEELERRDHLGVTG
jgi:hypothetical protein